jgi:transcriptional regulator of heat shock response
LEKANRVVMNEIGNLFVKKREDFIFLLQNSGISANDNLTDGELIDLFLANIHDNKKLLLGTAFFISHNNKIENFDGDSEHNESGIKATTKVLYNYFDSGNYDDFNSSEEEEEETSNVVGAIAGAIGGLANLGSGIIAGQNKKKYGVTDLIAKKQEAKTQMVQQILAQRQAQQAAAQQKEKEQQKQKKNILIGVGVLLLSAIIGTVIYFKTKKK